MPPRQGRICSPRRARVHHNPAERLRGGGRGVLRYRPERSQGEQHTKEKWTAVGRACVLPVPAQADFPSLWLNIPCSQADPLLPDNEHSVQGELLFRDFSSRRVVGRVGEKGKCGQGWIYRRESCGKRKCTAIPWAVFVDQIKPLPEPIPIYLCSIRGQSASMRKEGKNPPKSCCQACQWLCSFSSTWVACWPPNVLEQTLNYNAWGLAWSQSSEIIKIHPKLQTTKIMMCSFTLAWVTCGTKEKGRIWASPVYQLSWVYLLLLLPRFLVLK